MTGLFMASLHIGESTSYTLADYVPFIYTIKLSWFIQEKCCKCLGASLNLYSSLYASANKRLICWSSQLFVGRFCSNSINPWWRSHTVSVVVDSTVFSVTLKSQKRVFASMENPNIMAQFLFKTTLQIRGNYKQVTQTTDDQEGNGLQRKKLGPFFFLSPFHVFWTIW